MVPVSRAGAVASEVLLAVVTGTCDRVGKGCETLRLVFKAEAFRTLAAAVVEEALIPGPFVEVRAPFTFVPLLELVEFERI